MIFPDPSEIVNGEEVTNPSTGVIYVYDKATNSWNIKMQDAVDTSEYATVAYSDSEDAKLKALIDANAAQIEEWANSISSGSYEWHATVSEVGQVASIPSTQGNWSVVTKIAFDPTPIGIGAVSVANMSIGDIITFTSPSDDDYATFEISGTDSVASTIDVTLVDSEGGPAYGTTIMVKHYPQIDTSNFVTNVEFNSAVGDLQDQIDNLPVPEPGADVDHTHPDYSLTTHTHAYSPVDHNHGGDYSEIDHDHDDIKQGLEDLNESVAELFKAKPVIFKCEESLPLQDGDFTVLGENGLSITNFADAKSIVWNQTNHDVVEFIRAGYLRQTIKMNEIGDPESWMIAELQFIDPVSGDWTISPWYQSGTLTGDAEYVFELLPPYTDVVDLQSQINSNQDRIVAIETELEALAETREVGEWELVPITDFDVRGSGQFAMSNPDLLSSNNNSITLNSTDANGVNHGFDRVEVGDYVEVVQENLTRGAGDYGLWRIDQINGNSFELTLEQSKGSFDANSKFIVRFFYVNEAELDMAGMDARYVTRAGQQDIEQGRWYLRQQNAEGQWRSYIDIKADNTLGLYHVQNPTDDAHAVNRGYLKTELDKKANTHSHPYASSTHTHSYADSSHTHDAAPIRTGTSTPTLSRGELFYNTSNQILYVGA